MCLAREMKESLPCHSHTKEAGKLRDPLPVEQEIRESLQFSSQFLVDHHVLTLWPLT